jgi:hypothetical protein
MGPEIVAAILGPILGGVVSVAVWTNKKNSEHITRGFEKLGDTVRAIELKIDTVKYEMARNYVTNDILNAHIAGEETWHQHFNNEMQEIRQDLREVRRHTNKL